MAAARLPLFIGDEVTAAGYRLAGFDVQVGAPEDAAALLAQALREARPLVLIAAPCAARVPAPMLDAALAAFDPPVAVVGDAAARVAVPDFTTRVRTALGITA